MRIIKWSLCLACVLCHSQEMRQVFNVACLIFGLPVSVRKWFVCNSNERWSQPIERRQAGWDSEWHTLMC